MGCDIHMYAEVLTTFNGHREWRAVGPIFEDMWHRPEEPTFHIYDGLVNETHTEHPYESRNYSIFGVLAGVRNRDPDRITPIAMPRGLPLDVSEHVMEQLNSKDWYHSYSHVSLKELQTYPWYDRLRDQPFGIDMFVTHVIPKLTEISKLKGVEDVRIVFAFDN